MLSSVTLNCQVTKIVWIRVLNFQNTLHWCHWSNGLIFIYPLIYIVSSRDLFIWAWGVTYCMFHNKALFFDHKPPFVSTILPFIVSSPGRGEVDGTLLLSFRMWPHTVCRQNQRLRVGLGPRGFLNWISFGLLEQREFSEKPGCLMWLAVRPGVLLWMSSVCRCLDWKWKKESLETSSHQLFDGLAFE